MKELSDVDPQSRYVKRRRRSPDAGDTRLARRSEAAAPESRTGRAALRARRTSRPPRQGPKIVEFKLTIEEKEVVIDEHGTKFQAMTFNGSMPGPLMVVHEGDYVELTLINPDTNTMPHNIDFHAATGALGGGALTLVNPGEQVVLRWKATRTGVFVYHCAPGGPMIPWHVVSGMNGAVMVLPRDGLKDGEGKALQLRQDLLHRRAGPLCAARREGQVQDLRDRPARPTPTPPRSCAS